MTIDGLKGYKDEDFARIVPSEEAIPALKNIIESANVSEFDNFKFTTTLMCYYNGVKEFAGSKEA